MNTKKRVKIELKYANVLYFPDFISSDAADKIKEELLKKLTFEKKLKEGRLTGLYGSVDRYDYALNQGKPEEFCEELIQLKKLLADELGHEYNVALCNYYVNGKEQFRFHADKEEIGNLIPIASFSFGAKRKFEFMSQLGKDDDFLSIELEHGSLLLIDSIVHEKYFHRLPKDKSVKNDRLNVTFRYVKPDKYDAINSA